MKNTSTITTKGQVTVPKEFRDAFGWKPGDRVVFVKDRDGVRVMRERDMSRGERMVAILRTVKVKSGLTTDQILRETREDR
jgi:AbrB family looped-hinge helix DNA binding protein